jgi:hypothetical protein
MKKVLNSLVVLTLVLANGLRFGFALSPASHFETDPGFLAGILSPPLKSRLAALARRSRKPLDQGDIAPAADDAPGLSQFPLPRHLDLGNVIGVIEFPKNVPGVLLLWGDRPPLDPEKHRDYLNLWHRHPFIHDEALLDFLNFLDLLAIPHQVDATGTFIYIEKKNDLKHVRAFYEKIGTYVEELATHRRALKTAPESDFVPDGDFIDPLFRSIRARRENTVQDLYAIRNVMTEYLRRELVRKKVGIREVLLSPGTDTSLPNHTSAYIRLIHAFETLARYALSGEIDEETPTSSAFFQQTVHCQLAYDTMMSDWLRDRAAEFERPEGIDFLMNPAYYRQYLYETYLYRVVFDREAGPRPFDTLPVSFRDKLVADFDRCLKEATDDDIQNCFFAMNLLFRLIESFGHFSNQVVNETAQLDPHARTEKLEPLLEELHFLGELAERGRKRFESERRQTRSLLDLFADKPRSLVSETDRELMQHTRVTLDNNTRKFSELLEIVRNALENQEKTLVLFYNVARAPVKAPFRVREVLDRGNGATLFYLARYVAPDVRLRDGDNEGLRKEYALLVERLDAVFEEMKRPALDIDPLLYSGFPYLFHCDPHFFRAFFFWDRGWPREKTLAHLDFLDQVIRDDPSQAPLACLQKSYYHLLEGHRFPEKEPAERRQAKKWLREAFARIEPCVDRRMNTRDRLDPGYFQPETRHYLVPNLQEANRLVNFFLVFFFTGNGEFLEPTLPFHMDAGHLSFDREKDLLREIVADELQKPKNDIDWDLVIAATKFQAALVPGLYPSPRSIEEELLSLVEHGIPPQSLNALLVGLMIDRNAYGLVYADALNDYWNRNAAGRGLYRETHRFVKDVLANRWQDHWQTQANLVLYYFHENRAREGYRAFPDLVRERADASLPAFDWFDTPKVPEKWFANAECAPLKPVVRRFESYRDSVVSESRRLALDWIERGNGDPAPLIRDLEELPETVSLRDRFEWLNPAESRAALEIMLEAGLAFRAAEDALLERGIHPQPPFKPGKGVSPDVAMMEHFEKRSRAFERIFLALDRFPVFRAHHVSVKPAKAARTLDEKAARLRETDAVFKRFFDLHQALSVERNLFAARGHYRTLVKDLGIDPTSSQASAPKPPVRQKKTRKYKKKKKKKKQKKERAAPSAGEGSLLYRSLPDSLREAVHGYLSSVKDTLERTSREQDLARAKLSRWAKRLYRIQVLGEAIPFVNIEESIRRVETVIAEYPRVLSANLIDPQEDPGLLAFAEKYVTRGTDSPLLDELVAIRDDASRSYDAVLLEFYKLLDAAGPESGSMKRMLAALEELRRTDTRHFRDLLREIARHMADSYGEMLPRLSPLASGETDRMLMDHSGIPQGLYLKLDQLRHTSGGLLKWLHRHIPDFKGIPREPLELLFRVHSRSHAARLIQILKIQRLKLAVQNEVEEIRKQESLDAFVRSMKLEENPRIKRYNALPEALRDRPHRLALKLDALPGFLPGAPDDRKYRRAMKIFRPGDRLVFFKDREQLLRVRRLNLPIFEITNIEKDSGDRGRLVLGLVNRHGFPPEIKMQTLIDKYLPDPEKEKETFFLVKETTDLRNRLRLIDEVLSGLCGDFKIKGTLDNRDTIRSGVKKSKGLIDALLGLVPDTMKTEIERMNGETPLETAAPASLNEAQREIFDKINRGAPEPGNPLYRVHLIEAPGGTGKTYFLNASIAHQLRRSISHLVVAPTHRAVDNAARDLLRLENEFSLVRLGSTEAAEKMDREIFDRLWTPRAAVLERSIASKRPSVWFATSTGFEGDPELNALVRKDTDLDPKTLLKDRIHYDEAGMDPLDELLYLVSRQAGENTKIILLGDALQLSPYGLDSETVADIRRMLGSRRVKNFDGVDLDRVLFSNWPMDLIGSSALELFHGEFGVPSHYLTENFRSTPAIVDLLNEMGYSEYARTMVSRNAATLPRHRQVLFLEDPRPENLQSPEEWMKDLDGTPLPSHFINRNEIYQVLFRMDRDLRTTPDLTGSQMTFISPYRAQNRVFDQALWSYALLGEMFKLHKAARARGYAEIAYPGLDLASITDKVNDLVRLYGKRAVPIDFSPLPEAEDRAVRLSESRIDRIFSDLKERLPHFVPRRNFALNLERITDISLVDLSSTDPDVTTIQKVQGRQNRAIYFSAVRKNAKGDLGFMFGKKGPGMLITAMGRAREMLRVAADEKTWERAAERRPQSREQAYQFAHGVRTARMMRTFIRFARRLARERPDSPERARLRGVRNINRAA